jgi:hypothetical protein
VVGSSENIAIAVSELKEKARSGVLKKLPQLWGKKKLMKKLLK